MNLLREAFGQAPIAQILLDPHQDRIIEINRAALAILGLETFEEAQVNASHIFHASLPELLIFTQEALEYGQAWADNIFISSTADQQIRVEISARVINFNCEERYLHLCFNAADHLQEKRDRAAAQRHYQYGLTHWLRSEKVFQEFERENHLILEAAGEGIYGVDAEGQTTFFNPAAERMLGWKAEDLIGKNIHNVIHHSHADGCHYEASSCPIYQAFRDGIVHSVEDDVFWTKEGKAIDVEYTSTPIKDNGHLVGAVVIFRDVSERKRNQLKLLNAMNEVEQLKKRLEMENAYLQEEINSEFNHHHIIGRSAAIQHVIEKIELVAPVNATVLITGESGTGKELIARAIHESSERSHRPLIRVNCAAIPENLFESEFFGHSKGAFTGANSDKPGRFELANGGTLFLDEVGEIPLQLQGKLLRVLQEQQFERLGETKTRNVDVRIIAATNRDLKKITEQGEFREDLYFRLNVFPIESISLRHRLEDIPLLAQHFLKRACQRTGKQQVKIPLSEIEKLQFYNWPGNIRELENLIERQVILCRGNFLHFDSLNNTIEEPSTMTANKDTEILTEQQIRNYERSNLINALKSCQGKVFGIGGVAELLDAKPTTLSSRIKKLKINVEDFKH